MPITFATGATGGGKGIYAIRKIKHALDSGKKVATNLDLYVEHITDKTNNNAPIRLPDKPAAVHMRAIGYGSDPNDKNKDNYGLIVLDEISLFLDTKKRSEFDDLMAWFVQRRKFHWDIIFIAQHHEQVQETFYKALCDHLVVCKAKDLVPIPYIGDILPLLGLKGVLPEGHIAFKFVGRSPLDALAGKPSEFKNKPYRKMYDTDQKFEDGEEFLNNGFVDMRAMFTYLPNYVLSKQKYIDYHQDRIKTLKGIGDKKMAKNTTNLAGGLALKMKIGFFILVILAVFYFNNPMDSKLLGGDKDSPRVIQNQVQELPLMSEAKTPEPQQNTPILNVKGANNPAEFFDLALDKYQTRLNGFLVSDGEFHGRLTFYDNGIPVETFNLSDIRYHGFNITRAGSQSILINLPSSNRQHIVSMNTTPIYEQNDNADITRMPADRRYINQ